MIAPILLLLATAATAAVEPDKQQHAVAGAAVYGLTFAALSLPHPETGRPVMSRRARRWTALGVAIGAGVLKEALDSRDPEDHTADWRDAAATTFGGAVPFALCWSFDF